MFFLKKFYDTAEADTGGGNGTETVVLEKPEVKEVKEPVNIAAAMAKAGKRSTDDSLAKEPIINKEVKEEPKAEAKNEKVETTTTTSNEAKANSESHAKEEEKEVIPSQKETVTHTQPSWQEVLKSQQPDTVLKELGFDDKTVKIFQKLKGFDKIDFFSNLIDEWKSKGDLKGYLKELSTDYLKMNPEEVMRHQLREEYPKANSKQFEILFQKKVTEAYNLDSEDDDLKEEGKMLLEAEADRYRDKFVETQKSKLFPEVPEVAPPEEDHQAEKQQQEFEAYMSTVNKDPYAEKVFENKQIIIGKGDDKYIIKVDPEAIKNVLYDTEKWTETQFEKSKQPDGSFKYSPKVQNQILTAQFALDPQKFINDLFQHAKSLGGKTFVDSLDNAKIIKQETVSNTESTPINPAEAMAKKGVRVSSGM